MSDIDAVLEAEAARLAAIHGSDWAALDQILGEDLVYTHMSGLTQGKDDNVLDMKDKPRTYRRSDLKVQVLGDVALMRGVLDVEMHASGGAPARALHGRTLQVWANRDGRWQMIAFQATAIPAS